MEEQKIDVAWSSLSAIENSAQSIQHHYFTAALGGLVARVIPMDEVQKVLDVGCGPGSWAIDMAKQYPRVHVTGIDIDEPALRDARLQGYWSGNRRLSFLSMDATKLLAFADGTFDLVYMRNAAFLRGDLWRCALEEIVRVSRPGGWVNLVEYEPGLTSSDAFNLLTNLHRQAMRSYTSHAEVAPSFVIRPAAHLYYLLLETGLLEVSYTVHALDFGSSASLGTREYIEQLLATALRVKPFICRLNLIKPRKYDKLMMTARQEMMHPNACGYAYLISATGCKNG